MEVSVSEGQFNIAWIDSAWGSWDELQKAPEYVKLVGDTETKLKRSYGQTNKGAGKGPHH